MADKNRFFEELAREIAGKDGVSVLDKLKGKVDISEFKLAESLKLGINYVRNILYKFHEHNLVSFLRQKDVKKGWYIYYWTFDEIRAKELLIKLKERKLEEMKKRLEKEQSSVFFACPDKDVRLNFEDALECGFKCEECGAILVREDNSRTIKNLEEVIGRLEKDLGVIRNMKVEVVKRKIKKIKEVKKVKKKKIRKEIKKKIKKKKPIKKKKIKKKIVKKKLVKRVKKKAKEKIEEKLGRKEKRRGLWGLLRS